MSPHMATKIPAPTKAQTDQIGIVKPVGTPLFEASVESEYYVFAIHIGRLLNPHLVKLSI